MMISRSGTHALNALTALGDLPDGACAGAACITRQISAPSSYLDFLRSTTLADLAARRVSGSRRTGGKIDRAAKDAAGGVR